MALVFSGTVGELILQLTIKELSIVHFSTNFKTFKNVQIHEAYLNPLHCDHITGEITCRIIIIQTVYIYVYRKKNLPFIFATKMEQQYWGIKTRFFSSKTSSALMKIVF